ncbi:ABC transporter substrate-binding protein [Candidatus Poribacteria bacterium]|nr:ABC transporter substrate-binding protein [Candidatus Poribacteria bacterium]MYG05937.1 ABC transporter substrate-binding protein [Candidatus Poribacteria bacterium]MYK24935.1 ABC transporter substrate-binding protein [Candidatus Poribacteria bacterium]
MNSKKIITFAFVSAIVVLIVGFIGCERVQQIVQPTVPQMEAVDGEILVGAVYPMTGPSSLASSPLEYGIELAVSEINNSQHSHVKIKLITEDGQSTVEGAVEAFNQLIHEDKVSVILGPGSSSQAQEAFPIAHQNQVVAISPSSAASGLSAISDFVFRTNLTTGVLIPNGVRVTQEKLGYQKVATLFDEVDLFSRTSDAELREALTDNGVEILTAESFQTDETDLSTQFTRIKALNPDAIFISATVGDISDILIRGRALGVPSDIPFIVNLTLSRDLVAAAGDAAEGAITFTSWDSTADTPGNQTFVQNYSMKYGIEPNIWAAQFYAAVHILAKGIADAESTDPKAIAAALAEIRDFETILGPFSFNEVGDAVYDPIVLIVKDGEFEIFE